MRLVQVSSSREAWRRLEQRPSQGEHIPGQGHFFCRNLSALREDLVEPCKQVCVAEDCALGEAGKDYRGQG